MDYMNIGERAVVPGTDIMVECIESNANCSECVFHRTLHCDPNKCNGFSRDDGKNVTFIRVD